MPQKISTLNDGASASKTQHLDKAEEARLELLDISQKREVFHRALLSSGLVKRLATPRTEEEGERYMIMVQGEPLSKTILQERR